ncbi:MAG: OmpA family protein [Saprospiraceae bacterium]|nr:OmpA family protein [Saprospiraceae bacterium]
MYKFILTTFSLALLCSCQSKVKKELALRNQQVAQLEQQIEHMQSTTGSLLDRMADLSVVNRTGAESIQKSLESIGQQYSFIEDLTEKIQTKDSLNLALVMNLKRSLSDINDEDVQIEVRGGVVFVSISDRLLFRSGSSSLSAQAEQVLSKLAAVLNDHSDLSILVEGHTDDVPITTECVADNWDLSAKRATSVVRTLQQDHFLAPDRLTAAGRAEYIPKSDNHTEQGRQMNRRTEIILTPKLDQFFKLLEQPELKK